MTTPPLNTIGARIVWLRLQRKMSQASLARAIHITPQSLSGIESGKSKAPSAPTLLKIAAVLEANPDWIINGRGHPTNDGQDTDIASEMIRVMRELSHDQQATLLAVAKSLKP